MSIVRRTILFPLLVLVAPAVFLFVGMQLPVIAKDAAQYHSYAINLTTGHGYSIDGATFSTLREPGYPFFLAVIYGIFGAGNLMALVVVQTALLGLLGLLVYRLFVEQQKVLLGLVAGLVTSLAPWYGLYTHIMSTEILFTVLLGILFYICVKIALSKGDSHWYWYAMVGAVSGYATLVRVQLLFFLPILALLFIFSLRPMSLQKIRKLMLAIGLFMVVIGSWMFYVHQHAGTYSITSGRPEVVLYMRAARAQLSYAQLTQYAYDWLHRSISGGLGTPFLMDNEFAKLGQDYNHIASTSASVAAVKKQNIAAITGNLGHYLYGNLIEILKLSWIEHDYSDFLNRYFRASLYVVAYALFLFGLVQVIYKKRERNMTVILIVALTFIAYNYLVLTPFDTIPRYNTPYLVFYLIVGIAGVALWRDRTLPPAP